jgi:UDP-3-O-[3-hydroxymyristoyl] glucosamine N-acyltransferase
MIPSFKSAEIASLLEGVPEGDINHKVCKLAKIEEGDEDSLCFIANPKYEHYANTATAGVLLIRKDLQVNNAKIKSIIRVDNPQAAFAKLLSVYQQFIQAGNKKTGIEPQTFIGNASTYGDGFYLGAFSYLDKNVRIGKNVSVYPNCFIGESVTIGDNTVIHAGVKIYDGCSIGANCIIHAGAVIGGDGFGYIPTENGFQKVPQTGIVVLEDDVEIGANTVIDRATLGTTIIHKGVKLDNLVHIAHNVEIGEHSAIAAQTGVSGSTKIGKHVLIGGQVGIVGHIKIEDGVKINAQSGISKSISKNKSVSGSPATDFREHYKQLAQVKRIPELLERIKVLEEQLKTVKA